ncbi:hypothetical protein ACFQO1_04895 [Jejudonia soesokkakensis]|uniref:YkuD domain-containing protein n=1 Tax=Jejudonia soesokkakensis TaxID=1323432 RepID=A0ABW2MTG6_9FLAO
MKKIILLVAVFLIGNATQTFAQRHQNVIINQGTNDRYYNSNETIRFVEDGVLYTVTTNGHFDFEVIHPSKPKYKKKKNRRYQAVNYHASDFGAVRYNQGGKHFPKIKKDRYGTIIRIGKTEIDYKRNGKVRTIGCVPFYYNRGRLVQAGNMKITYTRFGTIRATYGHINKFNREFWHDDWYVYNEYRNDFSYQHSNTRIRIKK